jgi:ArsR family transcriptional regulator, lead/cadmium/zinc/bismuth-responsive transcriptional repressor
VSDERCDILCLDLPRAEELRAQLLEPPAVELIAARMRALADPTRLLVVDALARGGELCGCDLAWIIGRAQNLVSHHLRALRAEGLAASRRDGKVVFYALTELGARLYADAAAGASTIRVGAR